MRFPSGSTLSEARRSRQVSSASAVDPTSLARAGGNQNPRASDVNRRRDHAAGLHYTRRGNIRARFPATGGHDGERAG